MSVPSILSVGWASSCWQWNVSWSTVTNSDHGHLDFARPKYHVQNWLSKPVSEYYPFICCIFVVKIASLFTWLRSLKSQRIIMKIPFPPGSLSIHFCSLTTVSFLRVLYMYKPMQLGYRLHFCTYLFFLWTCTTSLNSLPMAVLNVSFLEASTTNLSGWTICTDL